MSLRPRYAGDGSLRLPGVVSIRRVNDPVGSVGDVYGEHGLEGWDPFERTDDGLLLAEAFARFDFTRPRKAQQWYLAHGVLDLARMFPDESGWPHAWGTHGDAFHDRLADVLDQQRVVRWHLRALARLSTQRPPAHVRLRDRQPHPGWDPSWAQPALRNSHGDVLWLGASCDDEGHIPPVMQRYPRFEDALEDPALAEYDSLDAAHRVLTDAWWEAAHRAWLHIQQATIPVLWVSQASWNYHWIDYTVGDSAPSGRQMVGRLSADWYGLLELERRLIEPYVQRAGEGDVLLEHRRDTHALTREGEGMQRDFRSPLAVHERRWWSSLLAPVFLQLVEGLLRVSEGRSGAAFCRECGQPFLTLDARRSSFCNDRHRFRWSQREHRRRAAVSSPAAPKGVSR